MLSKADINTIQSRIRAGQSKKKACETEARRVAFLRWEKSEQKKEAAARRAHVFCAENQVIPAAHPAPEPELSTRDYCEKIQRQVLKGISIALSSGEPWAYKEAVNILSKLLPEWKEKSSKKQVPMEEYKKILEKALRP